MEPAALLALARDAAGAAWEEAAAKERCAPLLSLLSSGEVLVASMGRAPRLVTPMTEDVTAAAEVAHCKPAPASTQGLPLVQVIPHVSGVDGVPHAV